MFKDKVIIITGSTQGIGLRTAEILASKGAKIVVNSRSDDKVEEAVKNFQNKSIEVFGLAGDVSNFEFCQDLATKTLEKFGRIDYLINNAGLASSGKLQDMQAHVYKTIFDVNVLGSLYPTMAVLEEIKKNKGGILFISSIAGILGLPGYSAYAGSKRAIVSLAESFRNELVDDGVYVGINYPGFTENDSKKQMLHADGKSITIEKRDNVKVEPLDKTVNNIIRQIEAKKFRSYSNLNGRMVQIMYRFFPKLSLYIIKLNRQKIMGMK